MTTINIHVSKETILEAAEAQKHGAKGFILFHCYCPIGLVLQKATGRLQEVMGKAVIWDQKFHIWGNQDINFEMSSLPPIAIEHVSLFDGSNYEERIALPEITFDLEVPDHIAQKWVYP